MIAPVFVGEEETSIVDVGYLDAMLAAAPPVESPEARDLGDGVLVSPSYMQAVAAAAREERQARLGAGHP